MKKQKLTFEIKVTEIKPSGNWNTAKDWFPIIRVDQEKRHITIETHETSGYQEKASVTTESCKVDLSKDQKSMFVRGSVSCRNWRNSKCSGEQSFCFAIFVGDTDHIYIHRAPATKGWMEADPSSITGRLRKLGIGVEKVAYQQGDFLLKVANGSSYDNEMFLHETMGSGHHKFVAPILYADGPKGRQYWVKDEPVLLVHHATDGIQHPDQVVQPGKYIVGTTASQLAHRNKRD